MAQPRDAGWQLSHAAVWRRKAGWNSSPQWDDCSPDLACVAHRRFPWFLLCCPFTPSFSSSSSIIFNPSFTSTLLPSPSGSHRSAQPLNINKAAELQKEKRGKEIGRRDWGREAAAEESGRQAEGMKATTEKSVFSGLVERWPSLKETWTSSPPRCSRYQSVL